MKLAHAYAPDQVDPGLKVALMLKNTSVPCANTGVRVGDIGWLQPVAPPIWQVSLSCLATR